MPAPSGLIAQQVAVAPAQVQQANFLFRTCKYCNVNFLLGPGDALYGDEWYHGDCWDKLRGTQADVRNNG